MQTDLLLLLTLPPTSSFITLSSLLVTLNQRHCPSSLRPEQNWNQFSLRWVYPSWRKHELSFTFLQHHERAKQGFPEYLRENPIPDLIKMKWTPNFDCKPHREYANSINDQHCKSLWVTKASFCCRLTDRTVSKIEGISIFSTRFTVLFHFKWFIISINLLLFKENIHSWA